MRADRIMTSSWRPSGVARSDGGFAYDRENEVLTLRAASVSSRFLESLESCREPVVLGVHDLSLNLLCGEDALSLVGSDAGNLPTGVLVDLPHGTTWEGAGLSTGAR